jgi:hypothetical protein
MEDYHIPVLRMKFEDAQNIIINYLQSDAFKQSEDAESTQKSVPTLVEINRAGYITDCSQEGDVGHYYNKLINMYTEYKERAFVYGLMKKEHGEKFIKKMNNNTNKIAFEMKHIKDGTEIFNPISVTCARDGPQLPISSEWETSTNMWAQAPHYCVINNYIPSELVIIPEYVNKYTTIPTYTNDYGTCVTIGIDTTKDDCICVVCIDPQYGRQAGGPDGLYQSILENL